jgi:hypothetical protein
MSAIRVLFRRGALFLEYLQAAVDLLAGRRLGNVAEAEFDMAPDDIMFEALCEYRDSPTFRQDMELEANLGLAINFWLEVEVFCHGRKRPLPDELVKGLEIYLNGLYKHPVQVQLLRLRLAQLGIQRGEDVVDNFSVAAEMALVEIFEETGQHAAALSKLQKVVAGYPCALHAASNLCEQLFEANNPVEALRVAERSLRFAVEKGWNSQAAHFSLVKARAIMDGARGRRVTVGAAVRPLVEDARQRVEAARSWLPKTVHLRFNAQLTWLVAGLSAGAHVDSLPAVDFEDACPPELHYASPPKCSQCGVPRAELKRCGGCKAHGGAVFYCDARCQKRHWPAHRPECQRLQAAAARRPATG